MTSTTFHVPAIINPMTSSCQGSMEKGKVLVLIFALVLYTRENIQKILYQTLSRGKVSCCLRILVLESKQTFKYLHGLIPDPYIHPKSGLGVSVQVGDGEGNQRRCSCRLHHPGVHVTVPSSSPSSTLSVVVSYCATSQVPSSLMLLMCLTWSHSSHGPLTPSRRMLKTTGAQHM
jgi:hypothetical protein